MLPLGTPLPTFELAIVPGTNLRGDAQLRTLDFFSDKLLLGKPLLVMVICAHCPFVKHLEEAIAALDKDYGNLVQILAIASNSLITHPQDGPENLAKQAEQHGWRFPYLLDLDQNFAKALRAACTPDFFLFSQIGEGEYQLRYRGQFDSSRPGNDLAINGGDLRTALNAVLLGETVLIDQKPSIGCNIKWHPGNEPPWFG